MTSDPAAVLGTNHFLARHMMPSSRVCTECGPKGMALERVPSVPSVHCNCENCSCRGVNWKDSHTSHGMPLAQNHLLLTFAVHLCCSVCLEICLCQLSLFIRLRSRKQSMQITLLKGVTNQGKASFCTNCTVCSRCTGPQHSRQTGSSSSSSSSMLSVSDAPCGNWCCFLVCGKAW